MNQRKTKFRLGIFHQLLGSYVVFAVLMIISFALTMFVVAFGISKGNMNHIMPYMLVDEQGHIGDLTTLTNMGGWIEVLDEDYQVIAVHGTKQTSQMTYTPSDLYQFLGIQDHANTGYIGFLTEVTKENKNYYYIVFLSRSAMSFQPTLLISSDNELAGWGPLVATLFLGLFGINCMLLSHYLSKKIKKPLGQLASGMQRVREGEQHVRLDFKTEAEFEAIRDTFNRMMTTIETQREEKEVLEQKKSKMLLELSHDIKTPIATIKSYAKALEAGLVEADKRQDYYKTIDRKADRVCHLAEDLFMMLKMDQSEYKLQRVTVDLCELLRKICVEYYDEIDQAGLLLEPEIPEQPCKVSLDPYLFTRVITNLITNAIKYNQTGQLIRLSLYQDKGVVAICVVDDGTTISEEMQGQLFDAFSRGDRARKSDGGTGLGLAIAKAIVEKHGGELVYTVQAGMNCFKVTL